MPDPVMSPTWISSGQLRTQLETLELPTKKQKLFIGVPRDFLYGETRVPLIPSAVRNLSQRGHRIIVERGAGEKSNFRDLDYTEAGAEMSSDKKQVFQADILLKTAPPSQAEYPLLQHGQTLISPLTIPFTSEKYLETLKSKKIAAIATEYLMDADGSFPLVRSMSEIAGISVISTASYLLSSASGGRGKLLGSISGVAPAKVVILGAGIVAEYACRAAMGMGAEIRVYDDSVYKLMRLRHVIGQPIFTSSLSMSQLAEDLRTADVVIGAVHSAHGRSPMIVSEEMVMNMKKGSVIIDVSIDQGGCFETSEVTSHEAPTFVKHDVIHYCVPNITSVYPNTASTAISNVITSILDRAGKFGGMDELIKAHAGLRNGVYTYKGCLTNEYLSRRFNMKYTDLDLLLPSDY